MGTWPPHGRETRPWRQSARGGTSADRMLREIEVALPPMIADLDVAVDARLIAPMEAALLEVAALDRVHGRQLEALGVLLLRTEAVASSKIEHVSAELDDYARALHGSKASRSASAMVAATDALAGFMASIDRAQSIEAGALLSAHRTLMHEDPHEKHYAGRLRDVQNWIGGSDHSPRNALYVPPPPGTVGAYVEDLVRFANRRDVSTLAQAAIAHAQFESVHPFTDGNGRIGRALINGVLRARGVTTRVVVPLASALVAHRDRYFDQLGAYRVGDPGPLIASFTLAARIASEQSSVTARRLARLPDEWRETVGGVRSGSVAAALLDVLPAHPVVDVVEAGRVAGGGESSVYAAIERLVAAGVLRPLTERRRNQVWGAADVLDELDDLGGRIAAAAR
jgi:Fic family protein